MRKDINKSVILGSLIGIGFVTLGFFVNWLFMAGAVVMMVWNQKELMKEK